MRFGASDWDDAVAAIKAAQHVVVACHVNPDGDALGSALGSSLALRKLGKQVTPTWGSDDVSVPPAYHFLPGSELIVPPSAVPAYDVFLALDCGASDRLGSLEQAALASECLINVDHHGGNEGFGKLNVVVDTASSTAELVARLFEDVGVALDRDVATCFYTGIVTDTGRFQYASTSPETLRLAGDLLEFGVPIAPIGRAVFESAPFGYLKLLGRVLERAVLDRETRFLYSWIERADLDATGVALDQTENVIDVMRSTADAEVTALFKQQPDGRYRVSLRSRGEVGVAAIARARGGGGHELAAGFTADGLEEGVRDISAALRS